MTRAIEGGSNVRPKDSSNMDAWKCFTLHNDRLSKLAEDIHNSGLGNIHRSYLSIIQPLSAEQKLPKPDNVIALARKHAKPHERLQHFEEAVDIYLWLFRTAKTFPRESSILAKAIAILMENLRTVALTTKLREAQQYSVYRVEAIRAAKTKLEKELKQVDRTVLSCLMSLYKGQRRQWECDILQDAGPTMDGQTSYPETFNHTPLHQKCQMDRDINEELAALKTRDINQKDIHDWTPLHYAAANSSSLLVEDLLAFRADANARDPLDWTPLHYACNAPSDGLAVRFLLKDGRSQVNAQSIDGVAPLHCAAMNGDIRAVEILVQAGAALDIQDASGNTALHWAAFKGHGDIVKYLYEDSNKKLRDNNRRTALRLAAMAGMENVVRLLVPCPDKQTVADMDAFDYAEYQPLHWAAMCGHEAIVRYLVNEASFDKDAATPWGHTTPHLAASQGQEDIVRYLVDEAGANKEARDTDNKTPAQIAAEEGYEVIVRILE
ncbi:hypothetical protein J3459_018193 [Metarhizium acridum]|nr:hypothetical protein J3459_018193 [Metarhizium acridum]